MSDYAYQRLRELDRAFLIQEGPDTPMHVGAVQIHEAAPLRGADGAIDVERILAYVASRLHRLPRYRQRVEPAPLGGHPIWVDDARFNLRYHVRHSRLPRPGDERLLKRSCARIFEQRLDLHKPLWELWIVEGLEGDRVALVHKVHHAMVDGVSGAELMRVLMTPEPVAEVAPAAVFRPRRGPTAREYATAELVRLGRAPFALAGALRRLAGDEDGARRALLERARATGRALAAGASRAAPLPFNQPVGPHRRVDWLATSLDEIGCVRAAFGGTVNDVALAIVAGALRRYLGEVRRIDLEGVELRVMAPVSTRAASERGALGNRVAAWVVTLPLAERDRRTRLERVREETGRLKERHESLGAETLTQALEWLGATPIALGARLLEEGAPFHLVVTNVPGPRQPLYLLGARLLEAHPLVPLVGTLGIGIALFSYGRTLSWGFTADWERVPDLHDLVEAVAHELRELRALAEREGAGGVAAAPPGRTARRVRKDAAHPG
ncbi:MAG: wax ester/triacylglycerol synthase family O-acyltransferase [Deltaproteobacteria bacterium]|nr:wax ester/triacylglycerol synthase family O-acyltransferase [Deltaproteobacteria bacterium]